MPTSCARRASRSAIFRWTPEMSRTRAGWRASSRNSIAGSCCTSRSKTSLWKNGSSTSARSVRSNESSCGRRCSWAHARISSNSQASALGCAWAITTGVSDSVRAFWWMRTANRRAASGASMRRTERSYPRACSRPRLRPLHARVTSTTRSASSNGISRTTRAARPISGGRRPGSRPGSGCGISWTSGWRDSAPTKMPSAGGRTRFSTVCSARASISGC